jgi:SAM-dependent methyltransferase
VKEEMPAKSYSSERGRPLQLVREAAHLVRGRAEDVPRKVAAVVERLSEVERLVDEQLDVKLSGLRMLDLGAGQLMSQMAYFSLRNEVVGIDLDVIVRGFDLRGYLEMLRKNGAKRVVKTVGRKALLVDARYWRELARQLDVPRFPPLEVLQMDASRMTFEAESFDVVYALAVFQHLAEPARALDEMVRVLKPGGVVYVDFILYTSRTGSHDIRLLGGADGALPLWAHLRPQLHSLVRPNAYVNRIRLRDWVSLLEERLPGFQLILRQPEAEWLEREAKALWEQGELTDYDRDELITSKVVVLWRKPA